MQENPEHVSVLPVLPRKRQNTLQPTTAFWEQELGEQGNAKLFIIRVANCQLSIKCCYKPKLMPAVRPGVGASPWEAL